MASTRLRRKTIRDTESFLSAHLPRCLVAQQMVSFWPPRNWTLISVQDAGTGQRVDVGRALAFSRDVRTAIANEIARRLPDSLVHRSTSRSSCFEGRTEPCRLCP